MMKFSGLLFFLLSIPLLGYTQVDSSETRILPKSVNFFEESPIDTSDCTCQGVQLYGKVKIVDAFPDLKVQIVDAFPDLRVKYVNSFPEKCGEWQIVGSFPDIKIQIVENFPDLKIQLVNNFPGIKQE